MAQRSEDLKFNINRDAVVTFAPVTFMSANPAVWVRCEAADDTEPLLCDIWDELESRCDQP